MDTCTRLQGDVSAQIPIRLPRLTLALVDRPASVFPFSIDRDKPALAEEAMPDDDVDAEMLEALFAGICSSRRASAHDMRWQSRIRAVAPFSDPITPMSSAEGRQMREYHFAGFGFLDSSGALENRMRGVLTSCSLCSALWGKFWRRGYRLEGCPIACQPLIL